MSVKMLFPYSSICIQTILIVRIFPRSYRKNLYRVNSFLNVLIAVWRNIIMNFRKISNNLLVHLGTKNTVEYAMQWVKITFWWYFFDCVLTRRDGGGGGVHAQHIVDMQCMMIYYSKPNPLELINIIFQVYVFRDDCETRV